MSDGKFVKHTTVAVFTTGYIIGARQVLNTIKRRTALKLLAFGRTARRTATGTLRWRIKS